MNAIKIEPISPTAAKQENKFIRLKIPGDSVEMAAKISPPKKVNMGEFRELFTALFKIKDVALQARVMKAINGMPMTCPSCNYILDGSKRDSSYIPNKCPIVKNGSTIVLPIANLKNISTIRNQNIKLDKPNFDGIIINSPMKNNFKALSNVAAADETAKAQRMKRIREPHAVKQSMTDFIVSSGPNTIQQQQQRLHRLSISSSSTSSVKPLSPCETKPKIKEATQRNSPSLKNPEDIDREAPLIDDIDLDLDLFMAPYKLDDYVSRTSSLLERSGVQHILHQMQLEWETAFNEDAETGLLPIHIAALNGDLNRVKRQTMIYNFRNIDINIKSNDTIDNSDDQPNESQGNTPLHYAVLGKNPIAIVNHLLENRATATATNNEGDTVLHYAIKHTDKLDLFRRLLETVELHDLNKENDRGLSVLHVAVNEKKFLFAKAIVQYIDEKLSVISLDCNIWNESELKELYRTHISTYILPSHPVIELQPKKMALINQKDAKSGRTALFYAIHLQSESLVYMLLAHYADPRITDLSGVDCSYFSTEVILNRVLAAAIYNTDYLYKFHIESHLRPVNTINVFTVRNKRRALQSDDTTNNKERMHLQQKILKRH